MKRSIALGLLAYVLCISVSFAQNTLDFTVDFSTQSAPVARWSTSPPGAIALEFDPAT